MKRILVVSVEPPWPAHHGGRIRTARVAEALSHDHEVLVAFPSHGELATETPVPLRRLAWTAPSSARTRLSSRPHLGGHFLAPVARELEAVVAEFRPDVVYWSHSYLAAWAPRSLADIPQVVEFANIEGRRLRSLATTASRKQAIARAAEAAKAVRWEPAVARRAALCVALSEADLLTLREWKADAMLVPNGVDTMPYEPSPADGYVLSLASYDYEPNVAAARRLLREVWPEVRREVPWARLLVAGRKSEVLRDEFESTPGVHVVGTLDDVTETYAKAALSVAGATTGGGSQLKITESLSRGRSVVTSSFAAQGISPGLRDSDCYQVADDASGLAGAIRDGLVDPARRHERERAAVQACQRITWSRVVGELSRALDDLR